MFFGNRNSVTCDESIHYFFSFSDPIECDCHMAWLYSDSYYYLNRVNGQCANGTYFSSFHPDNFAHCPTDGGNPSTTMKTTTVSVPSNGTSSLLFQSSSLLLVILFAFLSFLFSNEITRQSAGPICLLINRLSQK